MTPEQISESIKETRHKLLGVLRGGAFSKPTEPSVAILACLLLAAEMTRLLGKHSSNAFCRLARDTFRNAGRTIGEATAAPEVKA